MKNWVFPLLVALYVGVVFLIGFEKGKDSERQKMRQWIQDSGAVGAPGNPLGIGSTNYVVIEK